MHNASFIAFAVACILTAFRVTGCAEESPIDAWPAAVDDSYRLVWSDEFDGMNLDTTRWMYRGIGPRRDGINTEEAVALSGDGLLNLTTSKRDTLYYTAMLGTQGLFEPVYGYFECKVRLQKSVGHWSAFWLQSPAYGEPVGDPGRAGAEIDIFEYLRREGDAVHHTVHWDGYDADHKQDGRIATVPGLSEGWHTFGLLWEPDGYAFYVDDEETWTTRNGVSHRSQYLILSLEVGPWAGNIEAAQMPDSLLVDYVRVYQSDRFSRNPDR